LALSIAREQAMLVVGFRLLQEGITVGAIDVSANSGPQPLLPVVSYMGHACWLALQLNLVMPA